MNEINDYLLDIEDNYNDKNLSERKEIRKLRDKINLLVPSYCFLTEENKAPFANIDVELSNYKVVMDTKDVKKNYVERIYVPQFIENLNKSIRKKYSNIMGKYGFGEASINDFLNLAHEIHSTNYQDLLDALKMRAEEAETLCKRKEASIMFGAAKIVAGFVINLKTGGFI